MISPELVTPLRLSGVSNILEDTTKTCVANYAIHARKDVVRGGMGLFLAHFDAFFNQPCVFTCTAVPGILITGRQGMGKTSVAKEIAHRLEADERAYACEWDILCPIAFLA